MSSGQARRPLNPLHSVQPPPLPRLPWRCLPRWPSPPAPRSGCHPCKLVGRDCHQAVQSLPWFWLSPQLSLPPTPVSVGRRHASRPVPMGHPECGGGVGPHTDTEGRVCSGTGGETSTVTGCRLRVGTGGRQQPCTPSFWVGNPSGPSKGRDRPCVQMKCSQSRVLR